MESGFGGFAGWWECSLWRMESFWLYSLWKLYVATCGLEGDCLVSCPVVWVGLPHLQIDLGCCASAQPPPKPRMLSPRPVTPQPNSCKRSPEHPFCLGTKPHLIGGWLRFPWAKTPSSSPAQTPMSRRMQLAFVVQTDALPPMIVLNRNRVVEILARRSGDA